VSQLQALREVPTETAPFNELAMRIDGLPLEPRCRVCRNDEMRRKVNDLLSGGASYAMILRTPSNRNCLQHFKPPRRTRCVSAAPAICSPGGGPERYCSPASADGVATTEATSLSCRNSSFRSPGTARVDLHFNGEHPRSRRTPCAHWLLSTRDR
jgi:hypothetical protein